LRSVRSSALKLNMPNLISTQNSDGYLEVVGVVGDALNRVMLLWASGSSRDPLMLVEAYLALMLVSAIARSLPALRAASIDPARALRQE
jgi:hypothetical protein